MKTAFIIILFLLPTLAFSQKRWKTVMRPRYLDTTLVCEFRIYCDRYHTGSLDAAIDTGLVKVPRDWFQFEKKHYYGDQLVFNFEKMDKRFFGKPGSKKENYVYLVRGRIIGILPPTKGRVHEGYVFEVL